MITEIISKIVSESLLSLYPSIVKNIDIPFDMKLLTRFVPYSLISFLFIDYKFIKENLFSKTGLLLSLTTIIHIYASYKGFEGLESGVAYTIFYTYPLMILLMAGEKISPMLLVPLIGVALLVYENIETKEHLENLDEKTYEKTDEKTYEKTDEKTEEKEDYTIISFSVFMVFTAAFTEALLYFIVRDLKTKNNWNHLFISYFLGAVLLLGSLFVNPNGISFNILLKSSFIVNMVIGLFGYFLSFYAMTRLEPSIYAPLSYVGIIISHIYGGVFNGDIITWKKGLGSLLIIAPNVYMKLK
jgi:drug/metabolite transporter (DMT)-like permease